MRARSVPARKQRRFPGAATSRDTLDLTLAIRTAVFADAAVSIGVGVGVGVAIVALSDISEEHVWRNVSPPLGTRLEGGSVVIASPVCPGETLANKYRVERMLGQGGMGIVVAAFHLELEQPVAIKFLVGGAPTNAIERFIREARAAALVKSEHVCRVYDVGRLESGEPYIVMEYLEGIDLAGKLDLEGPQPIADAVGFIVQACDALSSAHAQGIVHRDLKPANLFLQSTAEGTVLKVVDFGISKLPSSGVLTSTSVMMGSPYYMSPEQLESSRDVDLRSDVWSLGVVLYETLTGVPPFHGESLVQLAVQTREKEPDSPASHRPEIPAAVSRVIMRCLAKRASDRYPNVNEIVADLADFAPTDLGPLVQKLARRARSTSGRSSDPEIVLSKTVSSRSKVISSDSGDKARGVAPKEAGPSPTLALAGAAFTPPAATDVARGPRRALALATIATAAVLGVLLIVLARKPAPAVGILQEAAPPAAPIDSAPPSIHAAALPVASRDEPSPTPSSAPSSAAISGAKRVFGRPVAHAPSAASSVVAAPAPPASTPAATTTPSRPKRDLDRDYAP